MRYASYVAVGLGLILVLSATMVNVSAQTPTRISLNISSLTVNVNDAVTFSGKLENANTGEGLAGRTITIFKEGMNPIPFLTAISDPDGQYNVEWTAELERNIATPITVWADFGGSDDFMPSRTGKTTFTIALQPIEMVITSDGNLNRHMLGDKALFNVAFTDGGVNFIDPDFLRATYDGSFVTMEKLDVGRYTFETPYLVKFEQHQFGVFAEKWGFKSEQKSLTITVFGIEDYKPMRITASKRGEEIRISVWNNILSPANIYRFTGTLVGALPTSSTTEGWEFSVDNANNAFVFKTTKGFVKPGDTVSFRLKTEGIPRLLIWQAFDLHGSEHSSVRGIAGDGSTVVKPIPTRG